MSLLTTQRAGGWKMGMGSEGDTTLLGGLFLAASNASRAQFVARQSNGNQYCVVSLKETVNGG